MSRIYDTTLKCGCMYSDDGGGGMIPCGVGYWEMTPKEFRNYPNPSQEEIDLHKSENERYWKEKKEEKNSFKPMSETNSVFRTQNLNVYHNESGEIFVESMKGGFYIRISNYNEDGITVTSHDYKWIVCIQN